MSKKKPKKKPVEQEQVETPAVEPDVDFNTPTMEASEEDSPSPTDVSATATTVGTSESTSEPLKEDDKPKKKRKKKVKEDEESSDPSSVPTVTVQSEKENGSILSTPATDDVGTDTTDSETPTDEGKESNDSGKEETPAPQQKGKRGYRLGNMAPGTRFRVLHTEIEGTLIEAFAEGDCKVKISGGKGETMLSSNSEVAILDTLKPPTSDESSETPKRKSKKKVDSEPKEEYNSSTSETNNQEKDDSEGIMKLNKSDCVKMLLACGVKTAKPSMKLIKCQSFVDGLGSTTLDEGYKWPDGTEEEQERYHKIVRLLQKGKEVEVVEDETHAVVEETKHETNGTAPPTPKKRGRKTSPEKAETNGETPAVPKKSKKKKASTGGGKLGPTIFEQSASAVLRWMGYKGFKREQAKEVCQKYGVSTISDVTMSTLLSDGKREDEKWGKRAVLKKEEEKEILKHLVK